MADFDWKKPGGKEIAIVIGGTLLLVVAWSLIRGRFGKAPAAAAASPSSGGGGTARVSSTAATSPEVLRLWLVDHAGDPDPRHKRHGDPDPRHKRAGRESYARQVASGTKSLEQVARERHTTVHHIIETTFETPELSAANRRRFERYIDSGTNREMPAGLIFYTSHQGSVPGETNIGGGRHGEAASA